MVKLRREKKDDAPPSEAAAAVDATAVMADAPPPAAPAPPAWEPPAVSYSSGSSSSSSGRGGLFNRMYGDVGEQSAAERDRVAAAEFQAVLAPAMELLQASVPEASSPEEAARILEQSQGELVPDPNGGSYVRGDAYDADARVYYRLLRRDYEKTPRPSEKTKRQQSPHLHATYGKLPGTRGW